MDFDPKKDYYKLLWVAEDASQDEIKKARRAFAVKNHPDRWGDTAKFQEVNEAYQLLSDEKKRQQYDMMRKGGGWFGWAWGFGGFGWFGNGWFQVDMGGGDIDLWDIMGDLFGGGRSRGGQSRSYRGEDITVRLSLSFEEAYLGTKKTFQYNKKTRQSWVQEKTCPTCGWKWSVVQQARTPFGVMQTQRPCPECGGIGKIYTKDGQKIWAGGLQKEKAEITVKIPSGIKNNATIKFAGKGDDGIGGKAGNLYINIQIKDSDTYQRKGNDLYVEADVSVFDLVLWGEIQVPHPEGKLTVKVPKGTQVQNKIRVKGKGYEESGVFSSWGDMYVIPRLHIPKKLSKQQEKLWKQLRDE